MTHSTYLEGLAAEYAATCPTGHASDLSTLGQGENLYCESIAQMPATGYTKSLRPARTTVRLV